MRAFFAFLVLEPARPKWLIRCSCLDRCRFSAHQQAEEEYSFEVDDFPFPVLEPLPAFEAPASDDWRTAYGLRFQSDFPLPELVLDSTRAGADVHIEVGAPLSCEEVARLNAPDAPLEDVMRFEEAQCQLLFTEVGRYTLRQGRHVLVEPLEGTTESSWRLPLLGTVMALLLEQRGLLALHGGAASFPGCDGKPVAAGFLGDKGQGKSTLNAALSQAGFALLCDDVLAVSGSGLDASFPATTSPATMATDLTARVELPTSSEPLALSGFAWLKLLPDAVRGVWNAEPDAFALVAPEVAELDKRSIPARLCPDALPLRALFILSTLPGDAPEPVVLRRMKAQEAFTHLMTHTFAARFGELYLKGARRAAHFRACSRLASECAVWELARKRDLALLPQTIAAVEGAVREGASEAGVSS